MITNREIEHDVKMISLQYLKDKYNLTEDEIEAIRGEMAKALRLILSFRKI